MAATVVTPTIIMPLTTPIIASNALLAPTNVPRTAVFAGGTDGIGKATLKALVSNGFLIKVYIVSGNKFAHQPFLEELAALYPKASFICVEGQTSHVAKAQQITTQIAAQEMSTSEGLETSLTAAYYSNIVFVLSLLPQIRAAGAESSACVINVLAVGQETTNLFLDDMDFKERGHFSALNYGGFAPTAVALLLKRVIEELANEEIAFTHAYLSVVKTDLFKKRMWSQPDRSDSAVRFSADF